MNNMAIKGPGSSYSALKQTAKVAGALVGAAGAVYIIKNLNPFHVQENTSALAVGPRNCFLHDRPWPFPALDDKPWPGTALATLHVFLDNKECFGVCFPEEESPLQEEESPLQPANFPLVNKLADAVIDSIGFIVEHPALAVTTLVVGILFPFIPE